MTKLRINLANARELSTMPGLTAQQVEAIVKYRADHGPILDARQLAEVLGGASVAQAIAARADFSPADSTAPEAPGA